MSIDANTDSTAQNINDFFDKLFYNQEELLLRQRAGGLFSWSFSTAMLSPDFLAFVNSPLAESELNKKSAQFFDRWIKNIKRGIDLKGQYPIPRYSPDKSARWAAAIMVDELLQVAARVKDIEKRCALLLARKTLIIGAQASRKYGQEIDGNQINLIAGRILDPKNARDQIKSDLYSFVNNPSVKQAP